MTGILFKKRELQLDTDRTGRLLLRLSAPQLTVNLINVIVGFFTGVIIAGMDVQYLAVYTIASPMCLSVSEGLVCGVRMGSASLIARSFGENDKIHSVIHTGVRLTLAHLALYYLISFCSARWFMGLFSKDAALIELGTNYIWVMSVSVLFSAFGNFFIQILQALGEMFLTAAFSLFSIPLTLLFNVVFIYGYLGVPRMGLFGSALTSIVIGALQMGYALFLLRRQGYSRFFRYPCDRHKTKQIMNIALPVILQQLLATVLVAGFNKLVSVYSEVYVVVMGIFYKWNSINQNLLLGASLMPVIGYNTSRNRNDHVVRTIRQAMVYTIFLSVFATGVYLFFPGPCLRVFHCPSAALENSMAFFRLLSLYIVPMSIVSVLSNVSIALGDGRIGMSALVLQTALTLGGGMALKALGAIYVAVAFSVAEWIVFLAVLLLIYKGRKDSDVFLRISLRPAKA